MKEESKLKYGIIPDTIGRRIEHLRTSAGMTQIELAEKLSLKRENLCQIENDLRTLKVCHLKQIALLFGVPSDYIIGLTDAKTPTEFVKLNQKNAEIIEAMKKLLV